MTKKYHDIYRISRYIKYIAMYRGSPAVEELSISSNDQSGDDNCDDSKCDESDLDCTNAEDVQSENAILAQDFTIL